MWCSQAHGEGKREGCARATSNPHTHPSFSPPRRRPRPVRHVQLQGHLKTRARAWRLGRQAVLAGQREIKGAHTTRTPAQSFRFFAHRRGAALPPRLHLCVSPAPSHSPIHVLRPPSRRRGRRLLPVPPARHVSRHRRLQPPHHHHAGHHPVLVWWGGPQRVRVLDGAAGERGELISFLFWRRIVASARFVAFFIRVRPPSRLCKAHARETARFTHARRGQRRKTQSKSLHATVSTAETPGTTSERECPRPPVSSATNSFRVAADAVASAPSST